MQIQVTIKDGHIVPDRPFRFKQERFVITVEDSVIVPDDAKPSQSFSPGVMEMMGKIERVLGENYQYVDNGQTDNERFTEALAQSGKYK